MAHFYAAGDTLPLCTAVMLREAHKLPSSCDGAHCPSACYRQRAASPPVAGVHFVPSHVAGSIVSRSMLLVVHFIF